MTIAFIILSLGLALAFWAYRARRQQLHQAGLRAQRQRALEQEGYRARLDVLIQTLARRKLTADESAELKVLLTLTEGLETPGAGKKAT